MKIRIYIYHLYIFSKYLYMYNYVFVLREVNLEIINSELDRKLKAALLEKLAKKIKAVKEMR